MEIWKILGDPGANFLAQLCLETIESFCVHRAVDQTTLQHNVDTITLIMNNSSPTKFVLGSPKISQIAIEYVTYLEDSLLSWVWPPARLASISQLCTAQLADVTSSQWVKTNIQPTAYNQWLKWLTRGEGARLVACHWMWGYDVPFGTRVRYRECLWPSQQKISKC